MSESDFDTAIAAVQREWVGRKRVQEDEIGLTTVRRVAGMLDLDPDSFQAGTPLPPHWFTLFFGPIFRQSDIGPDGHARPGVVLPPIPLPRRMGAGRRVKIMGRLRAAEPARQTTEVVAITPKKARTGQIAILTLRQTVEARGQTIAVDEFDAIYREAVPPGQKGPATTPTPAPTDAAWSDEIVLTNTLIFRYSAITWNAHRIHYDADYARGTEGYPNVVHNGGLTMHLILDAALKRAPGELTGYTARLVHPLFAGETLIMAGHAASDGKMTVWGANKAGALCAQLELEFAK
ncbi:MAG: hypothetical protein IRZ13_15385 [Acetobacteraceae bacterium]|nr:hypothetical protein [Acetobacteraceae bacterium]